MSQAGRRWVVLAGVVGVFGLVFVLQGIWQHGASSQAPRPARPAPSAVPMTPTMTAVQIELGLKDEQPTRWDGEVHLSEGKLLDMQVSFGGPMARVDGQRFIARSTLDKKKKKDGGIVRPSLLILVDAPATAQIQVKTEQGAFSFRLGDVPVDKPMVLLEGRVAVQRQAGGVRLTGRQTEDDFPALARGADGTVWLAYVEYLPGRPYVLERILAGNFEELEPQGNGDLVRLAKFDGQAWSPGLPVSDDPADVWRPTVAVDGRGQVYVAWAEQREGNWDIYYRVYTPSAGTWSPIQRLTTAAGTDFNVVATNDAAGRVWLAWQSWRQGQFDILATVLENGRPRSDPVVISDSDANDWSPSLTADRRGRVYLAWDTYAHGNYDVRLVVLDAQTGQRLGEALAIAATPAFEARPHIVCDAQDRVWIAYEQGDELWGKDFATEQFKRIPLTGNLGAPLYRNRTVQVKCLANSKLHRPAADLQGYLKKSAVRNRSLPQLVVDRAGGVWLFFRMHPLPGGAGEVWYSYATRYDGQSWGPLRRLAQSAGLLDNRLGLVAYEDGVLCVYSGDGRLRTQNRQQADLFAATLHAAGPTHPPQLVPDDSPVNSAPTAEYQRELQDVRRLREFQLQLGQRKYALYRGEFHRHTEVSAHRDGDGSLEDSWRYALDAGRLDWMGNGDHDNGFHHEYMWWRIQKTADLFHLPPYFVSVHSYERSCVYPNGHRNVILPRRGIRPLPRGNLAGSPEKGAPDTKLLYAYLKHFGGLCASHTSATDMGTDWRDNDPWAEPVVEIYQGHRHNYEHPGAPRSPTAETQIGGFRPAGFVWNALEKGYRLGFQSSSDHVSTHMSYGILFVTEKSRQGIIEAFRQRHCYAATDNILLVVRSGSHLMGDIFESAERPTLEIHAVGTADIAQVHIIRNNRYVYSAQPKQREIRLTYTDLQAEPGNTYYYYVRIEQADGNLAWASPLWITYRPK
ncbi:MAG: hypothetical protein RMI91_03990 [Gemmatales bacterium]|nr:hypothetical protein [Gemmatales bacterium]MDW7993794.1 hypothetical protein [Gemmatales bacterium]